MTERPILFSGPMVRAILDGRKSQTRRLMKPQPVVLTNDETCKPWLNCGDPRAPSCPYGQPGDRLWARETFMDLLGTGIEASTGSPSRYAYAADTPPGSYGDEARKAYGLKWRPSIFMPRAACRLVLEIVAVRVERLQDASWDDAIAEGLAGLTKDGSTMKYGIPDRDGLPGTDDSGWPWQRWDIDPRIAYKRLWDSINAKRAPWSSNPWVWVVEFKRSGKA